MKKKYTFKSKRKVREAVLKDVNVLFDDAKNVFKKDPERANILVHKARNWAMKHRVRLPGSIKRLFCKHCYCFLMPSVNCRVRTQRGKVVYYCLNCKKYMRFPYKKQKKAYLPRR